MPITQADEVLKLLLSVEDMECADMEIKAQCTADWIGRELELHPNAIRRVLRRLRETGRAHIHSWLPGFKTAAVWARGKGEDAPRPVQTDEEKAEYQRGYNRKWRADLRELRAAGLGDPVVTPNHELMRTLTTIERAKQVPQSWFAALQVEEITSNREAA